MSQSPTIPKTQKKNNRRIVLSDKPPYEQSLQTPYISGKVIYQGVLLYQPSKDQILQVSVELYEDRLVSYLDESKEVAFGVISLKNGVKLEFTDLENQDDEEIQFIYLQKSNRFAVFFCESTLEFQNWVNYLKRKCILSQFQEQYTFKKIIGKGSFAKVVLCTKIEDKKEYAVKVFEKTAMQKSKNYLLAVQGLQNEINIMQEINHPNIIKLYEVYEGQKHFYLVLELLTGGELFKKICTEDNFTEATVRSLMLNLLQALEYLHCKGIMHRDLKPENILIKKKGGDLSEIILADFGLSEHLEKKNPLFKRCGTPGYVAPEILADQEYDTQVDVFSAGIIILTGRSTFYGESYMEILNKNKQCLIDFNFQELGCKVSQHAEELLKQLLKRNPKERIKVKQALQHPWFKDNLQSENAKIHLEAMQKLIQQQYQLIKTTKPANITDSQNLISNSPLMAGVASALQSNQSSQKNSPKMSVSPSIMSPPQSDKKSKFATMHENYEKMNQNQYDVAQLKQKIHNPKENK